MTGILGIILLGLVKVFDNVITTAKSISTYQNKKILTSILVIISQFMFYFIVKSIVSQHGGSCSVENKEGGVEFGFRIPLANENK